MYYQLRGAIGLALVLSSGCKNEYKFDDSGGDWPSSDCYVQGVAHQENIWDLDTGTPYYDPDFETCESQKARVTTLNYPGAQITGVSIYGYDDVVPPGDVNPFVLMHDVGGGLSTEVYPDFAIRLDAKTVTEGIIKGGWDWYVAWVDGVDDLHTWNECYPNCEWATVGVEIIDPGSASAATCDTDYDSDGDYTTSGTGMETCLQFAYDTDEGTDGDTEGCVAGSGRFALVPTYFQDWNNDGITAAQFRPMQETGRYGLTSGAKVTSIKILDTHGSAVRVVHKDQTYDFDSDDNLVLPSRGNTLLTGGRATRFTRSQLRGDVQFVSQNASIDGMEADIAWSCPLASSATPPPEETLPTGYVLSLKDLGCEGLNQKVVVRPILDGTQGRVRVELYGQPRYYVIADLHYNERWYFDYQLKHFDVAGSFIVEGSNLEADIDTLTYRGKGVCEIGSYVLPKEG